MQTLTAATTAPETAVIAIDPVMERELFLANWDLMELSVTIPQAAAPVAFKNLY